jgi:periplasmic protein TonB
MSVQPTSIAASPKVMAEPSSRQAPPQSSEGGVLLALGVTSVALHLLITGILGFGVGEDPVRPAPTRREIPPTTLEQRVELEPAPVEEVPAETPPLPEELPPDLTVPVVADLALPPLPELTPITAVPPTTPVAFAIPVKGPVHLTNDPARATASVGGLSGPISLDANGQLGSNLVLPRLEYPLVALQRRLTGTVDIEFRVSTAGGRVTDARVRRSSGFNELDSAALLNLRRGRWLGAPGYYVKTFVFSLN